MTALTAVTATSSRVFPTRDSLLGSGGLNRASSVNLTIVELRLTPSNYVLHCSAIWECDICIDICGFI